VFKIVSGMYEMFKKDLGTLADVLEGSKRGKPRGAPCPMGHKGPPWVAGKGGEEST
jgi:hypothetical protein